MANLTEKDPTLKTVYKSKKKKEKIRERDDDEMRKPKLEITKKKHDFPRYVKVFRLIREVKKETHKLIN